MLSHFSRVWLFEILWTVTCQAPLSMWFYRQEYWSELPRPPPGNLLNPRIEPAFLMSPAWLADSLPLSHWGSCSVFWGDASVVVSTAGSAASVFWSVPMTSETHSRNSSWQALRMDSCFGSFCFFCPQTYHPFLCFPHSSLLIFLVFSQGTHVLNFLLCISSRKFCPWSHWLLNIFTCLNNISNSVLDLYIYFTYTSNSLLLNQTQPPKLVLLPVFKISDS